MPKKSNVISAQPRNVGCIYRAPLGTALPTDARTPLDAKYVELGYVSSDGWSRQVTKSYNAVNAFGGDEVARIRSELSVGFQFALLEALNADTQTAKWGTAAVTRTPATATHGAMITVEYEGVDTEAAVWVFDMDDHGKLHRTIFPNALDSTEKFEQTFADKDVINLPFECTAYRDDTSNLYFIDYTDDGKLSA